jgi:hypothetical protein
LINLDGIVSDRHNVGVGYSSDNVSKITLSDKAINKILTKKIEKSKYSMENLLKVLPMYIIPSQAERKLLEK